MIDLLRNYFDISGADDELKCREKVNGKIFALHHAIEDTVPHLFNLLGIVEGDDSLSNSHQAAPSHSQITKLLTLHAELKNTQVIVH